MKDGTYFSPVSQADAGLPALPSLLSTLNQHHTLQQEFKWRELEEQRRAERLRKRLQQERAYLLSLQRESKQSPGNKTKLPSDRSSPPQPSSRVLNASPQARVLERAVSSRALQTVPSDSSGKED